MKVSNRDRRALLILLIVVLTILVAKGWSWLQESNRNAPGESARSIDQGEQSLNDLRKTAALAHSREEDHKQIRAEVDHLEKSLIQGNTAAQAQAQLLRIVDAVATQQTPPLTFRQTDFNAGSLYMGYYGEVNITMRFECQIDDLINFMADLSARPELLATKRLRIQANPDNKRIQVSLSVAGLVRPELISRTGEAEAR